MSERERPHGVPSRSNAHVRGLAGSDASLQTAPRGRSGASPNRRRDATLPRRPVQFTPATAKAAALPPPPVSLLTADKALPPTSKPKKSSTGGKKKKKKKADAACASCSSTSLRRSARLACEPQRRLATRGVCVRRARGGRRHTLATSCSCSAARSPWPMNARCCQ
ncbi:hypothetical protein DAI22_01g090300 [Oryza sativa Japonica Group]|nr:hypothetical protein DAI22_01g090300 [Oryza sativa Japonica Group]